MTDIKKRRPYPSPVQKARLIELLEADSELRSGKFSASFNFKTAAARWQTIGKELNSIPGSKKTWEEWRKTWQDMKAKVKKKRALIRKSANLTGRGPPQPELSIEEVQVLTNLGKTAVEGHSDCYESQVIFVDPATASTSCTYVTPSTGKIIENHNPIPDASSLSQSQPNIKIENNTAETRPKKKRTVVQKLLQKNLEVAAAYNSALQEKNKIKRDFYSEYLKEKRKQTEAMCKQADAMVEIAKHLSAHTSQ